MQKETINHRLVKFIWVSLIFFALTLIQGAIITQESVRFFIHEGPGRIISLVHTHVGLMGWKSLVLMATIYYLVPIFSGKSIVWPKLIEWIFWVWVISLAAACVLMLIAGIVGGKAFADGLGREEIKSIVSAYAMPGGILCTISAIAGLMFVVQIFVTLLRGSKVA